MNKAQKIQLYITTIKDKYAQGFRVNFRHGDYARTIFQNLIISNSTFIQESERLTAVGIERINTEYAYNKLRYWYGLCKDYNNQPVLEVAESDATEATKLRLNGPANNSIDVKKYNNLWVGFEFEFSHRDSYQILQTIAREHGLKVGKTNGKARVNRPVELSDGTTFNVPVEDDIYKTPSIVAQVYNDGSVPGEVVTRPVLCSDLSSAKKVFDRLKELHCEMKIPSAGLHMTFLLDHHKELSSFDKAVVKNVIQLMRYYYSPIIHMFRQTERGTRYRNIPSSYYRDTCSCSHSDYYAVATRKDNERIWALEVRVPDGTDMWDMVEAQVRFYQALIKHAAKMAKIGIMYIPDEHWAKQRLFYERNTTRVNPIENMESKNLRKDLLLRLKKDLDFFKQKDEDENLEDLYETEQRVQSAPSSSTEQPGLGSLF